MVNQRDVAYDEVSFIEDMDDILAKENEGNQDKYKKALLKGWKFGFTQAKKTAGLREIANDVLISADAINKENMTSVRLFTLLGESLGYFMGIVEFVLLKYGFKGDEKEVARIEEVARYLGNTLKEKFNFKIRKSYMLRRFRKLIRGKDLTQVQKSVLKRVISQFVASNK
jgi:hypothetical protein